MQYGIMWKTLKVRLDMEIEKLQQIASEHEGYNLTRVYGKIDGLNLAKILANELENIQ
jgi:uncharacterized protein YjaG (DUF416 family)